MGRLSAKCKFQEETERTLRRSGPSTCWRSVMVGQRCAGAALVVLSSAWGASCRWWCRDHSRSAIPPVLGQGVRPLYCIVDSRLPAGSTSRRNSVPSVSGSCQVVHGPLSVIDPTRAPNASNAMRSVGVGPTPRPGDLAAGLAGGDEQQGVSVLFGQSAGAVPRVEFLLQHVDGLDPKGVRDTTRSSVRASGSSPG